MSILPTDLSGLDIWLKADALSLADNDPVSSWTDSSGNARHAVQANGVQQPLFKTNVLNGKAVVRGDGSNDKLISTYTFGTTCTLFMVGRAVTGIANQRWFAAGANDKLTLFDTPGQFAFYSTEGGGFPTIGGTSTNFTIVTFRASSQSNLDIYLNGTLSSVAAVNPSDFSGQTSLVLFDDVVAGTGDVGNVDIAELIVFSTALSTTDRQEIEWYLAEKYAISGPTDPTPEATIARFMHIYGQRSGG